MIMSKVKKLLNLNYGGPNRNAKNDTHLTHIKLDEDVQYNTTKNK